MGCDIGDWTHPTEHGVTDCDARLDRNNRMQLHGQFNVELLNSACTLEMTNSHCNNLLYEILQHVSVKDPCNASVGRANMSNAILVGRVGKQTSGRSVFEYGLPVLYMWICC